MESNTKYFKITNKTNNESTKLKLKPNMKLSELRNLLKSEGFISDDDYFYDPDDCFVLQGQEDDETISSLQFKEIIFIKQRKVGKQGEKEVKKEEKLEVKSDIKRSDSKIDPFLKEISIKIKDNKKTRHNFIKIQATIRGFLVRQKTKNRSNFKITETELTLCFDKFQPIFSDVCVIELNEINELYYGEVDVSTKQRHGRGVLKGEGFSYIGYWENNKRTIQGKELFSRGDFYEGGWSDDKKHGLGYESWIDGSEYKGQYVNGAKCGHGIFKWSDGSVYDGSFLNNDLHGEGSYKWSDGRTYNGYWAKNKMSGHGEFTWVDGRKYSGNYVNDKKEGYGVFEWTNGKIYKGNWLNGKQDGKGIYICQGKEKYGEWKDGKRIKWTT